MLDNRARSNYWSRPKLKPWHLPTSSFATAGLPAISYTTTARTVLRCYKLLLIHLHSQFYLPISTVQEHADHDRGPRASLKMKRKHVIPNRAQRGISPPTAKHAF